MHTLRHNNTLPNYPIFCPKTPSKICDIAGKDAEASQVRQNDPKKPASEAAMIPPQHTESDFSFEKGAKSRVLLKNLNASVNATFLHSLLPSTLKPLEISLFFCPLTASKDAILVFPEKRLALMAIGILNGLPLFGREINAFYIESGIEQFPAKNGVFRKPTDFLPLKPLPPLQPISKARAASYNHSSRPKDAGNAIIEWPQKNFCKSETNTEISVTPSNSNNLFSIAAVTDEYRKVLRHDLLKCLVEDPCANSVKSWFSLNSNSNQPNLYVPHNSQGLSIGSENYSPFQCNGVLIDNASRQVAPPQFLVGYGSGVNPSNTYSLFNNAAVYLEPGIRSQSFPAFAPLPYINTPTPTTFSQYETGIILSFQKRDLELRNKIIDAHLFEAIDKEDMRLYELVCKGDFLSENITFTDTTLSFRQILPLHKSGSAKSEGFYVIPSENRSYRSGPEQSLVIVTRATDRPIAKRSGSDLRDSRVISRQLFTYYVNDECGDLLKFNQLRLRKKMLRFGPSNIHKWGLFSLEDIPAEEMIIEYIGELIRSTVADERERRTYGTASSYFFRIDDDYVIDATNCGNLARFINHSCEPNCYAKIITVENAKKVVIYSKREIETGEEITYDYKFPIEENKVECHCGATTCRGFLN